MKGTFLMRCEWEEHLSLLTMEQRGELLTACFAYNSRGEEPEGDLAVRLAFRFMRQFFDENAQKYEARVKANQSNGCRGGRPRKAVELPPVPEDSLGGEENPVGCSGSPQKPGKGKKPDSVSESVSESDSVPQECVVKKSAARFTPPTVEEVAAYAAQRGSLVDAREFVDFYAAKGWMVGKTPMKDWKAACRNAEKWERWSRPTASERPSRPGAERRPSFAAVAARMREEGKA